MPTLNRNTSPDPTGTDGHADPESGSGVNDSPFDDPLAAMFGAGTESGGAEDAEDDDDDEGQAEGEDEDDSSADAEADADGDEDEDAGSETEDEGSDEGSEDEEEEGGKDEDEESDTDDDETQGNSKWKEQFKKLAPEAQKIVAGQRDAIVKLRRQKNTLREQVAEKDRELAVVRPQAEAASKGPRPVVPTPEDPLSTTTSEADVEQAEAWADDREEWINDALEEIRQGEEVTTKAKDGTVIPWTKEELKRELAYVKSVRKAAPGRKEWLKEFGEASTTARKAYPKLFTPGTAEHQAVQALMTKSPWLHRVAQAELMIGDALVGRAVREGKLVAVVKKQTTDSSSKDKDKPKPKDKRKDPPSSLGGGGGGTASGSAPAARPKSTTSNGTTHAASVKAMHAGKGDPLAVMFGASRRGK